ncbi:uncharacterized protein LOC124882487 [Girardinichthys multiradiatus]|uniref:uncharacterized protein LOC124882487 n=1 Tax=Girardinichthys multiradiatus TaxID=208333 RepID=UPI001FADD6F9|nr:uncharacterized protein LOC124882487 [Girardinichthys multiradiatus]
MVEEPPTLGSCSFSSFGQRSSQGFFEHFRLCIFRYSDLLKEYAGASQTRLPSSSTSPGEPTVHKSQEVSFTSHLSLSRATSLRVDRSLFPGHLKPTRLFVPSRRSSLVPPSWSTRILQDNSSWKPTHRTSGSAIQRGTTTWVTELPGIKLALKEWRHWLEGTKHAIQVWTDHNNLAYLQSAKKLNPRQSRWSLFFSRFDLCISFRPGPKPDAFSRQFATDDSVREPAPIIPPSWSVGALRWEIEDTELKAQQQEPDPGNGSPNRIYVPSTVRA